MLFIFPEIPRLVHPCYLGRMGAPENNLQKQQTAKIKSACISFNHFFQRQIHFLDIPLDGGTEEIDQVFPLYVVANERFQFLSEFL